MSSEKHRAAKPLLDDLRSLAGFTDDRDLLLYINSRAKPVLDLLRNEPPLLSTPLCLHVGAYIAAREGKVSRVDFLTLAGYLYDRWDHSIVPRTKREPH